MNECCCGIWVYGEEGMKLLGNAYGGVTKQVLRRAKLGEEDDH